MSKSYSSKQLFIAITLITISILISSCKKSADTPAPAGNDTAKQASDTQNTETTARSDGYQPITIELPRPMFRGTPEDIDVPNLEKPLGKPREPFYAPQGTTNVALNKPVSASDEESIIIGELELVTDGDKEAVDGSYVELGPMLQYITIDLEAEYNIYAIIVWHYHSQPRAYLDVIVQLADDPDFITNVRTVFNNDHDNSAGIGIGDDMNYVETSEGKLINAKGEKARYVRLYSNGNSFSELNHYIEVAVYGKPAN